MHGGEAARTCDTCTHDTWRDFKMKLEETGTLSDN